LPMLRRWLMGRRWLVRCAWRIRRRPLWGGAGLVALLRWRRVRPRRSRRRWAWRGRGAWRPQPGLRSGRRLRCVRGRPWRRRCAGDRHRRGLRWPADVPLVASELERQLRPIGIADVDGLTVVDVDHRRAAAVDEGPVQRTVVDGLPAALIETQQQMRPGDEGMGDAHVGAQIAPDDDVVTRCERTL